MKKEKVKTTYGSIQLFINETYDDFIIDPLSGDRTPRGFKDFLKVRLQKAKDKF